MTQTQVADVADLDDLIQAWPKLTEALKGRLAAHARYAATIDGNALAIRMNNAAVNGVCPVCGDRTDPTCGPELFVRGTFQEVCHPCGERLNPALMQSLNKLATLANDLYLGKCDLPTVETALNACPFYEPTP